MRKPKQKLIMYVTIVLFLVAGTILALFYVQGEHIHRDVSRAIILEATQAVTEKFIDMATPIERDLKIFKKWGESGLLDISAAAALNKKCIPLIESQDLISSLNLVDTDGREYFLYRRGDNWLTRTANTFSEDAEALYQSWDAGGALLETWSEKRPFDPRTREWFAEVLKDTASSDIYWTKPYHLHTADEVGITASTGWHGKKSDRRVYVAAVDLLLDDIYRFVTQLRVSPKARVFLIGEDGSVISARPGQDGNVEQDDLEMAFVSLADLEHQAARDALELWKKGGASELEATSFSSNGKRWWAGVKPLRPGKPGAWIAVVIPEEDLLGDLMSGWATSALIGVAVLLAGVVVVWRLIHNYSIREKGDAGTEISNEDFNRRLEDLISKGEGSRVEFKSTVRTNLKTGEADKAIEIAWMKAVAAFMNSEGGTLLIGVDDDGLIVGIGPDNFQNHDLCLQHIKNLINQHIGAEFTHYIQCDVKDVDDKTVVMLSCQKASSPVFFNMGKNEDFYIRSGPSSIKLSMSKMVKYLEGRE